jgi:hypothetical protein
MSEDDFNWEAAHLVQHEMQDVTVYQNPNGDVIIRQRAAFPYHQESQFTEDVCVVISAANAGRVARAILLAAGYRKVSISCMTGDPPLWHTLAPACDEKRPAEEAPAPMTSTERSRKHRAKQRDNTPDESNAETLFSEALEKESVE